MQYRRSYTLGAKYFFTVVTQRRQPIFAQIERVRQLRESFRVVQQKHPFNFIAGVVLPDHLHAMWGMTETDCDYSLRWQLVKTHFTRCSGLAQPWQKRFWEHEIKSEDDLNHHLDYIHFNPVKHGYAQLAMDWPHSSFRRFVAQGMYEPDWGCQAPDLPGTVGRE